MFKKLMKFAFTFALIFSMMPINAFAANYYCCSRESEAHVHVAGVVLKNGEYLAKDGTASIKTKPNDNYAYFYVDSGKSILTLQNYSYTVTNGTHYCIQWDGELTIELPSGTVSSVANGYTNIGSGWENDPTVAIQGASYSQLTIQGPGTLNATGYMHGIWAMDSITIEGGATVNAVATSNENGSIALSTNNGRKISILGNSTVNAAGGQYGIGYSNSGAGTLRIETGSKVVAQGSTAAIKYKYNETTFPTDYTALASTNEDGSSLDVYDSTNHDSYKYFEINPITGFKVTFNANGGNVTPESTNTNDSSQLTTLPTPTKVGYVFDGWYDALAGGNKVEVDKIYASDTTIYAQWKECNHSENKTSLDCVNKVPCSICGKELDATGHGFKPVFTTTEDSHYYECLRCDVKKDEAKHQYNNDCDKTCNICNFEREITHDYSDLKHDEKQHWYECHVCHEVKENSKKDHNGKATCVDKAKCTVCGVEYGKLDSENHAKDTFTYVDNKDDKTHTKKYDCCGVEIKENHVYGDDHICDYCSYADMKDYIISKGANQEISEDKEVTFISDADFSKFVKVQVDGKDVDEVNYTAVSGSTKITLKVAFVDTLSVGKHTLTIVSTDGEASTTFTIKDNSDIIDKTGDYSNISLWIGLMSISTLMMISLPFIDKKRKNIR